MVYENCLVGRKVSSQKKRVAVMSTSNSHPLYLAGPPPCQFLPFDQHFLPCSLDTGFCLPTWTSSHQIHVPRPQCLLSFSGYVCFPCSSSPSLTVTSVERLIQIIFFLNFPHPKFLSQNSHCYTSQINSSNENNTILITTNTQMPLS